MSCQLAEMLSNVCTDALAANASGWSVFHLFTLANPVLDFLSIPTSELISIVKSIQHNRNNPGDYREKEQKTQKKSD